MTTKLCKPVLKLLVKEMDKAVFRAEGSFGSVHNLLIASHPEIAVSEEEWNLINEKEQAEIIERAKRTLLSIS